MENRFKTWSRTAGLGQQGIHRKVPDAGAAGTILTFFLLLGWVLHRYGPVRYKDSNGTLGGYHYRLNGRPQSHHTLFASSDQNCSKKPEKSS